MEGAGVRGGGRKRATEAVETIRVISDRVLESLPYPDAAKINRDRARQIPRLHALS